MTHVVAESDATDMAALQRGETQALDRLMNRWQKPLRAFLYRAINDEATALDLAQEIFVRVYRNADKFRTDARFSTWLFTIATNLIRDRARQQKRRPTTALEPVHDRASGPSPDHTLETEERANAVRAAIAELPDDLRTAVVLFEYEEKSYSEIGEMLGTTPKAVETRLYRARQLLRKSLGRYFG